MDKKKSEVGDSFVDYCEQAVIKEKELLYRVYDLPLHKRKTVRQMLDLADKVRTEEYPSFQFGKTELMVGLIGLCTPLIIAIFLLGVVQMIRIITGGC